MPAIMADHDIEGQMQVLLRLLTSGEWHTLWTELAVRVESFTSLSLPVDISDAALWRLCQTQQLILITGNRNQEGPESLEAMIQTSNIPASLPVLTIGEPQRILNSREYTRRVVERLMEYLIDVENLRGTGRVGRTFRVEWSRSGRLHGDRQGNQRCTQHQPPRTRGTRRRPAK